MYIKLQNPLLFDYIVILIFITVENFNQDII